LRRVAVAVAVAALVASVCVAVQLVTPARASAAATVRAAAVVPATAGSWPFSEGSGTTTADSSGNGHTGTLGSGVTWAAPVVGAHSIALNGTAAGAVTVTGAVVNTAASYTASAWVYLNSIGGANQTFVSINGLASPGGTTISGFYLQFQGGTDQFAYSVRASDASSAALTQALGPANVAAGTWYHLVGVDNVSTGTISLYVNGVLQASKAFTSSWQATGNTMTGQGMYNGGATDFVNGRIDDVALYSSALTAAQVAALNQPVIATGLTTSCEISSGNASCWGDNSTGTLGDNSTVNSSVPVPVYTGGVLAGLTLTQISVGSDFACALSSAGNAYCWGLNSSGQLGNGTTVSSNVPVLVSGGLTFTQIDAGALFACALTSAGAAYCWGDDGQDQLGNTTLVTNRDVPVAVTGGLAFAQISLGTSFVCALTTAAAAYCWGKDNAGQIGNASAANPQTAPLAVTTVGTPLAGVTLTQISAALSGSTTCALSSAGAAYCWGLGTNGELGNGSTTAAQATAVAVTTSGVLSGVTLTQISGGQDQTCALDSTGVAYCWGGNGSGDLGINSTTQSLVPVAVSTSGVLSGKVLTHISASGNFISCALDSFGAAYCWGLNSFGQAGNSDTAVNFLVPATVAPSQPATVAAGNIHSCEIDSGLAYCWGDNSNGELGNDSTMTSSVPVAARTGGVLSGVTLTQITTGTNFSCALSSAGAVYCWGLGTSGQLGNNSTTSSSLPVAVYTGGALSGLTLTQITANGASACALASTGAAFCWGAGGSGQLGNGTTTAAQSTPVAVTTSGVLSGLILTGISDGGSTACALASTRAAFCWGAGGSGQLGNGTTTATQSTAVAVTAAAGVLAGVTLTGISDGGTTACALASTGAAFCWGAGGSGQLGNGTTTSTQSTAVAVTATGVLTGQTLTQITVGSNSSCALSSAGLGYCWGGGAIGQLGNGTTTSTQSTAVAVTATGVLTGQTLTQITVGTTFTCALSNTGADFCWGENSNGQDGNPATADNFLVPVAVMSESTMIASGYSHSCLLRNGKAYCWGNDTYGELGNNTTTTTPVSAPVAVYTAGALSGLTLIQISAGQDWTCALASTGAAYCWGNNSIAVSGDTIDLGNNTNTASSAPVLVSGGLFFTQISVGGDFACGLTSAGVAYCWGNNHSDQMGNGGGTASIVPGAVTATGVLSGLTLTQIDAGSSYTCALASTGAAYCWGLGTSGQLGNSASTTSSTAVAVTASGVLSGVTLVRITTGGTSTCALGSAGAAYCWGAGGSGQLGNGSTTAIQNTAVAVTATSTGMPLAQITAGTSFACAVDVTGAAWCWGLGTPGDQLGNNLNASSSTPVAVTATGVLAGVILFQISSGQVATCAQGTTGAFYCWGTNTNGQLGNASTTSSDVPVTVAGIVPGAPTSVAASRPVPPRRCTGRPRPAWAPGP
jgi:alpha-tubulin suppressor-like RCC1 family protein